MKNSAAEEQMFSKKRARIKNDVKIKMEHKNSVYVEMYKMVLHLCLYDNILEFPKRLGNEKILFERKKH